MEKEMVQISKEELVRLNGVDALYAKHVSKLGRSSKELGDKYAEFVRENSNKMSISDMYDVCKRAGMEMEKSTFRKFVVSTEVKELYQAGKTPTEIVDALKVKRKHNRMTVESVSKILEGMGYNPRKIVKGVEASQDVIDMASRIVRWNKGSQPTDVVINEIGFYKVLILSQMDDSVIYIPFEIIKKIKYRIEHIVDQNMDMTEFVAICTIKVDGVDIVLIVRFDQSSQYTRVQIVKSSRPQKDKNYDIYHIKQNYMRISLLGSRI